MWKFKKVKPEDYTEVHPGKPTYIHNNYAVLIAPLN
jgi:hypothetical protein